MRRHGGTSLLKYYNSSPSAVVMATFPEKDWVLYRFKAIPKRLKRFTNDPKTEDLQVLHPSTPDNQQTTDSNFIPTQLLSSLPEPPPPNPDENESIRELRKVFAHLETQLGVTRMDDWYRVSASQIQKHVRATRRYIESMGNVLTYFSLILYSELIFIDRSSLSPSDGVSPAYLGRGQVSSIIQQTF